MALQYYVYVLWSTFFAFWTHRPVQTWSILLSLHLAYGAMEDEINSAAFLKEFAIWKPLTLVMGCLVGVWAAYIVRAPATLKLDYPWWYNLAMITLGSLFVGTGFAWQLAPQVWWNYILICALVQVLLVLVSWVALPHDRVWGASRGAGVRVHLAFFMLTMLLNLIFAIGQSIDEGPQNFWSFYYVLIYMGASVLWFAFINIITWDSPPNLIATVAYAPIPQLLTTYV
jgi:hypothetical protein